MEKKEERLASYNNSLFKNKFIKSIANIRIEGGILPKFFKQKVKEATEDEKTIHIKTTAEERYADYIENYLNAENKFALKNSHKNGANQYSEQNILMFKGVPFVVDIESTETPALNNGNMYGTTQKISYRGLTRNRFGKFEYFDIQLQTDERLYLNATESKFANYKLFKKITSSHMVLGKNRFKSYQEALQTSPVYYTTNSTNPKVEHRKEAMGGGKLEKLAQRFNASFNNSKIREDDQEIIEFLNNNLAKIIPTNNFIKTTNHLEENSIL